LSCTSNKETSFLLIEHNVKSGVKYTVNNTNHVKNLPVHNLFCATGGLQVSSLSKFLFWPKVKIKLSMNLSNETNTLYVFMFLNINIEIQENSFVTKLDQYPWQLSLRYSIPFNVYFIQSYARLYSNYKINAEFPQQTCNFVSYQTLDGYVQGSVTTM
jgi:hypothetical protein